MNLKVSQYGHFLIQIAIIAIVAGEILTSVYFGRHYPGYDWKHLSISYLGEAGSPVLSLVKIWGIVFTFFWIVFGFGIYHTFSPNALLPVILIIIYGIGEGICSAFLPINLPGTPTTLTAFLHNLIGGIADVCLFLFPVIMLRFFKYQAFKKQALTFTWVILLLAAACCTPFLLAKYLHLKSGIFEFRGIWQRLYLACFGVYFVVLSFTLSKIRHS